MKKKLLRDIPYTRKEFEKQLALIGWRVYESGNGLNDFIVNDKGEETAFVIQGDNLEIRKELFGSSFSGDFSIDLKETTINQVALIDAITCISLHIKDHIFINFYKH